MDSHIWSVCLLDCQSACCKTASTRSMAPDFSHSIGNRIRFTKPLFQLRFIHCTMDFLLFLSFTIFLVLSLTTCKNLTFTDMENLIDNGVRIYRIV